MRYDFKRRTHEDVQEFLDWHFDGIYSFYNNDAQQEKIDWYKESVDNEDAFSMYNENDELVGNCEFNDYDGDIFMGLQMKPELTGNGMGIEFSRAVVEFGKDKYNLKELFLAVAAFNERAVKVYKKLGFKVIEEDVWTIRGKDYDFLIMKLDF